jgi:hypothetical protein
MTNTPGRRRWRPRTRKTPAPARPPAPASEDGPTPAGAMQLAIGLLTASLDSPELEAWAALALIPEDPEALADVIAGIHLVNLLCFSSCMKQPASRRRPRCRNSRSRRQQGRKHPSPDSQHAAGGRRGPRRRDAPA